MDSQKYLNCLQELKSRVDTFYEDFNINFNRLKSTYPPLVANGGLGGPRSTITTTSDNGIGGGDTGILVDIDSSDLYSSTFNPYLKKKNGDNNNVLVNGLSSDSAVSNGINGQQTSKQSSNCSSSSQMDYVKVPYGKSIPITLAYIYSARNFYVHLDYDDVECFWHTLNDAYGGLELDSLRLHSIEVANFYCADIEGEFQRVKVLADNQQDGTYDLLLVDFGEIKFGIKKEAIYPLLPQFASKPVLSLNCFIDEEWFNDLGNFEATFMHLVADSNSYCMEIRAVFSEPLEKFKFPVKLEFKMLDGTVKSVSNFPTCHQKTDTALKSFEFKDFFAKYDERFNEQAITAFTAYNSLHPSSYLDFNTKYKCLVSTVLDVSNFICIVESFNDKAAEFTNFCANLNSFYKLCYLGDVKLALNSLVVFRLDQNYFRGFIYSQQSADNQYDILSIDCGFCVTLSSSDGIFPLASSLSTQKFPPFAFLCEVDDIVPAKDGQWNKFAIKSLKSFLRSDITVAPRSFTDKYSVEVTTPNQNIGTVLKKLHFARSK